MSAHPAFHKACEYLDLEAVVAPVDARTGRADVDALAAAVTDRTVLVVASACSFPHGCVDPIAEIGQLALDRGLLFHVDGCIGGFLLPLARACGAEVPEFDLTVAGVTSISMDFHKYVLCAKGSSIVLYRDAALRRHQFFAYGDWPGYVVGERHHPELQVRGPLASTWATLRHFGRDGYLAIAEELRAATARAVELVEGIDGLRIVGAPEICLLAVGADSDPDGGGGNGGDGLPVDVFAVADVMEAKGWHMYPQLGHGAFGPSLHVTMLPWSTARIDEWGREPGRSRRPGAGPTRHHRRWPGRPGGRRRPGNPERRGHRGPHGHGRHRGGIAWG